MKLNYYKPSEKGIRGCSACPLKCSSTETQVRNTLVTVEVHKDKDGVPKIPHTLKESVYKSQFRRNHSY